MCDIMDIEHCALTDHISTSDGNYDFAEWFGICICQS